MACVQRKTSDIIVFFLTTLNFWSLGWAILKNEMICSFKMELNPDKSTARVSLRKYFIPGCVGGGLDLDLRIRPAAASGPNWVGPSWAQVGGPTPGPSGWAQAGPKWVGPSWAQVGGPPWD